MALEACFVAGRFATVWALRLSSLMSSLLAASIRNNPHARWQRGSSAGSIKNWIFYCSVDRFLARNYCLMGIGLGSNIFSRPLTMIGKVSPRCVTSQAARTRPSVYSVASRQEPESEHFTLLGFLVGVAISMALVGLHLRAGKEAAQPCPTSRGVAANLADLRFDTGEGYNRFH